MSVFYETLVLIKNNFDLNFKLNKKKYIEVWLQDSAYFHAGLLESSVLPDHIQGKPGDELSSSNSTDSSSGKEDFQRLSLYGSLEDSQIEMTDYSDYHPAVLLQENIELYPSESGQNFSYILPRNGNLDPSSEIKRKSTSQKENTVGEGNNLTLPSQRLNSFGPSKIGQNVRATLAYAALSAVTEGEETATCPGEWFDGHDEDQFHKPRRASTGSLNENLVCPTSEAISNNGSLETSILPYVKTRSCDKYVSSSSESVTDHQMRKALGHTRSKSDQRGVPKFHKHKSVIEVPKYHESENQDSFSSVRRMSSSLPTTSGKNTYKRVKILIVHIQGLQACLLFLYDAKERDSTLSWLFDLEEYVYIWSWVDFLVQMDYTKCKGDGKYPSTVNLTINSFILVC